MKRILTIFAAVLAGGMMAFAQTVEFNEDADLSIRKGVFSTEFVSYEYFGDHYFLNADQSFLDNKGRVNSEFVLNLVELRINPYESGMFSHGITIVSTRIISGFRQAIRPELISLQGKLPASARSRGPISPSGASPSLSVSSRTSASAISASVLPVNTTMQVFPSSRPLTITGPPSRKQRAENASPTASKSGLLHTTYSVPCHSEDLVSM